MNEREDEQEWPLRDWATRLRPAGGDDLDDEDEDLLPAAVSPSDLDDDDEIELIDELEDGLAVAPFVEQGVEPLPEAPEEQGEGEEDDEDEDLPPAALEHAGGEFRVPDGYEVLEGAPIGGRRAVAIVVSRFNAEITNRLLQSALDELEEAGVSGDAVLVMPVPGAFELPLAAMALAKTRRYACVVALGCVIRGETPHFDFVASEAASGLQLAAIETGIPVAFGLLTTDTAEQAEARVDKGAEAVRTGLEMADVFAQLRASARAAG